MSATRHYVRELGGALLAYVLLLVGSIWLLGTLAGGPMGPWRMVVALAPLLPGLLVVRAVVRQLDRLDELQRRVQLEALAFGFAATAVLTLGYGFLERAGLPRLSWILVWPLMAGLWLLGQLLATRRYR
jgi:hypothetical protein